MARTQGVKNDCMVNVLSMRLNERLKTLAEIVHHPGNSGRRADAVLDYLRWNFGYRAMGIEYVIPLIEGARLILSDRQNYATLVYTCGLWDFPEQVFLLHLLRPEDTFIDVGSNVGGYTVLASAVAGARSIAFEPAPETYAELRRNVRLNDIESMVETHCCALGEVNGANWITSGRGALNHIVSNAAARDAIEVPAARLDTVLAGTSCRLIKIDAEGFELNILRGAPDTLAHPGLQALIVELNGSGRRYGISDDQVHREIVSFGFEPCYYNATTRTLTSLDGCNRNGLNTVYVRDRVAVTERVTAARRFSLHGKPF
jgi:FkbM family methyltransferase